MSPQPRKRATAPPPAEELDTVLGDDVAEELETGAATMDTTDAAYDRRALEELSRSLEAAEGARDLAIEHRENSEDLLRQAVARIDELERAVKDAGGLARLDDRVGVGIVDVRQLETTPQPGTAIAARAGDALERAGAPAPAMPRTAGHDLVILAIAPGRREALLELLDELVDLRTV